MQKEWEELIKASTTVNQCLKIKEEILASAIFVSMKQNIMSADTSQKKVLGAQLNQLKQTLQGLVDNRIQTIQQEQLKDEFAVFDPSFVSKDKISHYTIGVAHPITATIQEIVSIFSRMGFDVFEGEQAIRQWDNFDSVNVPEFHPARDLQDTFFLDHADIEGKKFVLKTQATANFAEYCKTHEPPFRAIFPSLTFRNETIDATHEVNFHQFDLWMVDKKVSISDLVGLARYFFQEFFESDEIQVRFRPSFYPFVQPGFDMEIYVPWLRGGVWLEVAGAGPIHKKVFELNGIDPQKWQGIAWGFGVDRLFMIKHNINYISQLYTGNLKFLQQSKL